MNFREYLKDNNVLLDGGFGSMLLRQGLVGSSESFLLKNPQAVYNIHKSYFDSGSNVVNTNTFGVNGLKYSDSEIEKLVTTAIKLAKKAKDDSNCNQPKFISLDIGPLGKMIKPFGDIDFEDCITLFKKVVKVGVKEGVDLVTIETFTSGYETKAAVIAVKECCDLPILVSNAYNEDGKLLSGNTPKSMVAMLEGLGVDGIGANCSFGPKKLYWVIKEYLKYSNLPVIFKPNLGLPKVVNGNTIYDLDSKTFAKQVIKMIDKGVRIFGGCCGTTPECILELNKHKDICVKKIKNKNLTIVSSYFDGVVIGKKPLIVGERINPTGKKLLQQALKEGDYDYIIEQGVEQEKLGASILDVNCGMPNFDEENEFFKVVEKLQNFVTTPLQLDSTNPIALEKAMRVYNGKPLINSVNGKDESMDKIFPLVKKYGGVVVCLTMDDEIPKTVSGRLKIAEKIYEKAKSYGLTKNDLVFDTLCMTVCADETAPQVTLKTLKALSKKGFKTILGISNISYGLPNRDVVNGEFLAMALNNGLNLAIINPNSKRVMESFHAYNLLKGDDKNCQNFIKNCGDVINENKPQNNIVDNKKSLYDIIVGGLSNADKVCLEELKNSDGLKIINEQIIPALNYVGALYGEGKIYLPSLLLSAEASKQAFNVIKANCQIKGEYKSPFVIATVKGDIHDIGKNIVKLLLENYGYTVYDLGKDVDERVIVDKIKEKSSPLCGLSALMTTTLKSMESTVKLIKKECPNCKIIVGGAVLTDEFAKSIGCYYAHDGMDTVKIADKLIK